MPAQATHYEFGKQVFDLLEPPVRRRLSQHRHAYDMGQQGADIFFFYQYNAANPVNDYGEKIHAESAASHFARVIPAARGDEEATAYLAGLACHYTLDSICHPYVYEKSARPGMHSVMEAALDAFIMEKFGVKKKRWELLPVESLRYDSISKLWPDMQREIVRDSALRMRSSMKKLDFWGRFVFTAPEKRVKPAAIMLPKKLRYNTIEDLGTLSPLFDRAVGEGPANVMAVLEAVDHPDKPLKGFELNYKGDKV